MYVREGGRFFIHPGGSVGIWPVFHRNKKKPTENYKTSRDKYPFTVLTSAKLSSNVFTSSMSSPHHSLIFSFPNNPSSMCPLFLPPPHSPPPQPPCLFSPPSSCLSSPPPFTLHPFMSQSSLIDTPSPSFIPSSLSPLLLSFPVAL